MSVHLRELYSKEDNFVLKLGRDAFIHLPTYLFFLRVLFVLFWNESRGDLVESSPFEFVKQ